MNRVRIYCNSCTSETWHEIVADSKITRYVPVWGFDQETEAQILRCCGCDLFAFRSIIHPFEFQNESDIPEEEVYPDRSIKKRRRKFLPMPVKISRLYQETVTAIDCNLVLLTAVGLRSLIEAIVADKIDRSKYGNSLVSKITALAGIFEPGVIAVLQEFREMGNKAVHAQTESDHLDLHRALFVIEGIMEYFYGISESADTFKRLKTKPKKSKVSPP